MLLRSRLPRGGRHRRALALLAVCLLLGSAPAALAQRAEAQGPDGQAEGAGARAAVAHERG